MTFLADSQSAIDDIYTVGAVAATHTDRDSSTTAVHAVVEYDINQYGEVAEIAGMTALVSVRVSELAYPPRQGETYTIGGTVYVVDTVLFADDLEHRAIVA